ncbi:MAG: type II secretion system F family protein [Planctomycetota bacterium]
MSTATTQQTFVYQAMTPSGGKTYGVRTAADSAALAASLREKQLLLLGQYRLPIGSTAAPSGGDLPLKDELALNRQLATLLTRGVPLVEALEVAESVVSPKSRKKVAELRELVQAGASFSNACAKVGGFDEVAIGVYRSAERTGDLDAATERLAVAAERQLSIRGKAVTTLIYPSVIVMVGVVLLFVMMTFLVPMIAEQAQSLAAGQERELPWFSSLIFGLGLWMRDNLIWVLTGVGAIVVIAVSAAGPLTRVLAAIARRIPAIKPMLLTNEMARFFSVMAAMTRSGVPIAEALGSSVAVVGDEKLRTQLDTLRQELIDGGVLRTLIEAVTELPLATRRLLIAAERAGDLDRAFDTLAQDMAEELDRRADRLLALLEPAVIIGLAVVIGPIIVAIIVPMMSFRAGA